MPARFPATTARTVPRKARPTYDGHWWLSISAEERTGFLAGYWDCDEYEYKGPARFETKNTPHYLDLITHAYEASPAHRGQPAIDVLLQFRDRPGDKSELLPGGESASGAHGGNDGDYWRQMGASERPHDKQLGFVEGYLQCHEKLAHNKGGTFSKAAEQYRALISRWYRLDEHTLDVDSDREPEAIAVVLFKFRDQAK
jgi:hypothetical protein